MGKKIDIITPVSCGQLVGVLNYGIKEIPLENISLSDLQGVKINNPQDDDIFIYRDGYWVNEQRFNQEDIFILNGGNAVE